MILLDIEGIFLFETRYYRENPYLGSLFPITVRCRGQFSGVLHFIKMFSRSSVVGGKNI